MRNQLLVVPSFFAGWYTAEMPVWHIAWQVARDRALRPGGCLRLVAGVGGARDQRGRMDGPGRARPGVAARPARLHERRGGARPSRRRRGGPSPARRAHHVALPPPPVPAPAPGALGTGRAATSTTPATGCVPIASTSSAAAGTVAHRRPRPRLHPRRGVGHRGQARAGAPPPARAGPPRLGDGDHQLPPEPSGHVARPHRGLQARPGLGARPHRGVRRRSAASSPCREARPAATWPRCWRCRRGDRAFQPGFEDEDVSVDACVPFYGVYDMTAGRGRSAVDAGLLELLERRVFKRRLADEPEVFEDASPLYRVNPDAPPFFVIHGTNDTLVPVADARAFVEALRAGRAPRSSTPSSRTPSTPSTCSRRCEAPTPWPPWCASWRACATGVRWGTGCPARRDDPARPPGPRFPRHRAPPPSGTGRTYRLVVDRRLGRAQTALQVQDVGGTALLGRIGRASALPIRVRRPAEAATVGSAHRPAVATQARLVA